MLYYRNRLSEADVSHDCARAGHGRFCGCLDVAAVGNTIPRTRPRDTTKEVRAMEVIEENGQLLAAGEAGCRECGCECCETEQCECC